MSSKVHFCSTEGQTFYWSILTADDSIECQCANSGMTGQVGSFQNPGVCLQVFPSFLPHPPPGLLLGHSWCGLVPCSLLLNHTEMLARPANAILSISPYCCLPCLMVRNWIQFFALTCISRLRDPPSICSITFTHHPDSRTIFLVKKRLPSSFPLE